MSILETGVGPRFELESLRIRYRLADEIGSDWGFKLGYVRSEGSSTIKHLLAPVAEAGKQSIIDLYAWWKNEERNQLAQSDPAKAYEGTMPPVAILHQ